MKNQHIIIIGAGVAGLFSAYYLTKKGYEITIIDSSNGTDNCSYGNAGMIVPSHIIPLSSPGMISKGLKWMLNPESPFYIRPRLSPDLMQWLWKFRASSTAKHVEQAGPVLKDLLMASRELLIDLEQNEKIDFGYKKNGLFMFCNSEYGFEKEIEVAKKAQELGIPVEICTPERVKEIEPNLDINIIGATYYPKDAHVVPKDLMNSLKGILAGNGVQFIYNKEITNFETETDKILSAVSKDDISWTADQFIICSGAASASLSKIVDVKLLMQAGKGYSITLKNPKIETSSCGIFAEKKVTMTPMNSGIRFAGTMEIVGIDTKINQQKITGLKKSVAEFLPEYSVDDLDGHTVWTGLRPCSPDGLPYVGKLAGYKNLYTSTGHAMMGMSLAPSCGKIIAGLISENRSELYHFLIDPNRFTYN